MEYGKIIAISGMAGLYELAGSKKDGAIVRSLDDKSTKFVSSRIHNFSHLESIEVYTVRDNVNLVEVLGAMNSAGEALPSEKDNAAIKAYFEKVYADMDFERVYASDMKKMIKWYNALKANGVEFKLSAQDDQEEEEETDPEQVTQLSDLTDNMPDEKEKGVHEVNGESAPVSEINDPNTVTKTVISDAEMEEIQEGPAGRSNDATETGTKEAPKKKAPKKKKSEE